MGKQLDRLDEMVECLDLHDAAASQKRRQDRAVTGERPCVRLDHDLPGGGLPGLEQDDRFPLQDGRTGNLPELARIFERLDNDGDNAHLGILREGLDEILDRCAKLIPAGDKIGEAQLAIRHQGG